MQDLSRKSRIMITVAGSVLVASSGDAAHAAAAGALADSSDAFTIGVAIAGGIAVLLAVIGLGVAAWARRRAARALTEVRRLESLFDLLEEGVVICSGMQVIAANSSLRRMIGVSAEAAPELMISNFIPDTDIIDQVLSESVADLETQILTYTGEVVAVEISARTIVNAGIPGRLLEIRDIRDRKATAARISFLAHHDALTTLPNREALRARMALALQRTNET